jgi:fumarate hydratase subunit beta
MSKTYLGQAARELSLPLPEKELLSLRAGEVLLLSGTLYTARDAAHKKLAALLGAGERLPFGLKNAAIYYTGPCPKREGEIIGSCGPTTSGRMDTYTPLLIENGLRCMIGKGFRSEAVYESMKKHGAVYLGAIGGAGALYRNAVVSMEVVCFPELLSEAVHRLVVKDFPAVTVYDTRGGGLYNK